MTTIENPYLQQGNFAPVAEEVTAIDLPVTGTLPAGARRPPPAQRAQPHRRRPTRRPTTGSPATAWCTACASATGGPSGTATAGSAPRRGRRARRAACPRRRSAPTCGRLRRQHQRRRDRWPHLRHRRGRRPADRADRRARHGRPSGLRRHAGAPASAPTPSATRSTGDWHVAAYYWALGQQGAATSCSTPTAGPPEPSRCRPPGRRWCTTCAFTETLRPALRPPLRRSTSTRPWPAPACPTSGTRATAPASACCPSTAPTAPTGRGGALDRHRPLLHLPPPQRLRPPRRAGRARRRAPPEGVRRRAPRARRGPAAPRPVDDRPGHRARRQGDPRRPPPGVPPPRRAPPGPAPTASATASPPRPRSPPPPP